VSKLPKIWLACQKCGTTTDTPHISSAPHDSTGGFQIRARCPSCGNQLKNLSKKLFTTAQIETLRVESGAVTIGDQHADSKQ
jgi:uncharacterized paraquat-inducible protein A